jgi:hypothetical protein
MSLALIVYAIGAVIGILVGDERPAARIVLAALWPLGLIAFLVTLVALIAASAIAFPIVAATLVAAVVILWAFLWSG